MKKGERIDVIMKDIELNMQNIRQSHRKGPAIIEEFAYVDRPIMAAQKDFTPLDYDVEDRFVG